MTRTLNQIIFVFLHQNQNMLFSATLGIKIFLEKKPIIPLPPPFKLNGPSLRQKLFFSLLDIPQAISLNLVMFGSVHLNDEEIKAVFKSVQIFIVKSKRFTPWHAHIIFFIFSILFNLFLLLCSSKLCSFQLHAYMHVFFSLNV